MSSRPRPPSAGHTSGRDEETLARALQDEVHAAAAATTTTTRTSTSFWFSRSSLSSWMPVMVSFATGAACASIAWVYHYYTWNRKPPPTIRDSCAAAAAAAKEEEEEDEKPSSSATDNNITTDDKEEEDHQETASPSRPPSLRRLWSSSSSSLPSSSFSELPTKKRRSHWPWERLGRQRRERADSRDSSRRGGPAEEETAAENTKHEEEDHDDDVIILKKEDDHASDSRSSLGSVSKDAATVCAPDKNPMNDTTTPTTHDEQIDDDDDDDPSLCIGSIFGLDVGGSLAKLVYFERRLEFDVVDHQNKHNNGNNNNINNEHRLYVNAAARDVCASASAQAVLLARRGLHHAHKEHQRSGTELPHRNGSSSSSSHAKAAPEEDHPPQEHDDDDDNDDEDDVGQDAVQIGASISDDDDTEAGGMDNPISSTRRLTGGRARANSTPSSHSHRDSTLPRKKVLRRRSSHVSHLPLHSRNSEDDLRQLYEMRQESVPDNLHAYAETYHLLARRIPESSAAPGDVASSLPLSGMRSMPGSSHPSRSPRNTTNSDDSEAAAKTATTTSPPEGVRKSRSMMDFRQYDRKKALDRFYSFALRLDSYEHGNRDVKLSFYSRELGGDFHFIHFETRRMPHAMELIRAHQLHRNIRNMGATGGGAHKYAHQWAHELNINMHKQDELDSLVAGMQFILSTVAGECYTYRPAPEQEGFSAGKGYGHTSSASLSSRSSISGNGVKEKSNRGSSARRSYHYGDYVGADLGGESFNEDDDGNAGVDESKHSINIDDNEKKTKNDTKVDEWWWSRKVQRDAISHCSTYPYLLVTIGTGVSILRVDGPRQHERISGSTIGGGTYWGLIRLLTSVDNFEEIMRLAERGDPSKVDMMVGDIYGRQNNDAALEKLGLPSNLVASSFGKLVAKENPAEGLTEEDLARALLLMVTNNIGQVAYLNAKLHHTPRIYFVGNFLRENHLSQRRLSYAINYWSKGEMEALFLEHEGYFGALGAFLLSQGISHGKQGFQQWKDKQNGADAGQRRENKDLFRQQSSSVASYVHL